MEDMHRHFKKLDNDHEIKAVEQMRPGS